MSYLTNKSEAKNQAETLLELQKGSLSSIKKILKLLETEKDPETIKKLKNGLKAYQEIEGNYSGSYN